MKVRIAEEYNYEWKQWYEENDQRFIEWIPKEEFPTYEKVLEILGKGKVQIHTYPKYTECSALLKLGTDADAEEFLQVLEQCRRELKCSNT